MGFSPSPSLNPPHSHRNARNNPYRICGDNPIDAERGARSVKHFDYLPFGKSTDIVSSMKTDNVTTRLRHAIESSDRSRYVLAKESGVSESTLCKFMAGGSIRLDSVDRLCEVLELELIPKQKTKSKR